MMMILNDNFWVDLYTIFILIYYLLCIKIYNFWLNFICFSLRSGTLAIILSFCRSQVKYYGGVDYEMDKYQNAILGYQVRQTRHRLNIS